MQKPGQVLDLPRLFLSQQPWGNSNQQPLNYPNLSSFHTSARL